LLILGSAALWGGGGTPVAGASAVKEQQNLRTISLRSPFTPEYIVSANRTIWLVGTEPAPKRLTRCEIEAVDPTTLRIRGYRVPGCGPNVVVYGTTIYTTDVSYVKDTNNQELRIERFDTVTKRARVLKPVAMTLVGSAIAHTALTYGDGSLWLWGHGTTGDGAIADEVVQISASSGAVLHTFVGVPDIGGTEPSMVATGGSLWMAGGPGGSPDVEMVNPTAPTPTVVYSAPPNSSVQWVAAANGQVLAEVTSFDQGGKNLSVDLVTISTATHQVVRVNPLTSFDWMPSGSGSYLWAVGQSAAQGQACSSPLSLWRLDPSAGTTMSLLALSSPCVAYDSGVALSSGMVFVLVAGSNTPSRLYRLGTERTEP
jgi:hypothetical protein